MTMERTFDRYEMTVTMIDTNEQMTVTFYCWSDKLDKRIAEECNKHGWYFDNIMKMAI